MLPGMVLLLFFVMAPSILSSGAQWIDGLKNE